MMLLRYGTGKEVETRYEMMEKEVFDLKEYIKSLKVAAKKIKPGQDLETNL